MNLDGYYYPTQPGDVNDLRTWCTVAEHLTDDPDYTCESAADIDKGNFGAVYAMVEGFTFHAATSMTDLDLLRDAFKSAYKTLLEDDTVCAITCSVGFCAAYQEELQIAAWDLYAKNPNLPRKPTLLGTPALMSAFSPDIYGKKSWALFQDIQTEVVIVYTSYYPTMSEEMASMLAYIGVTVNASTFDPHNETDQRALGGQFQEKLGMMLAHVPAIYRGTAGVTIVLTLLHSAGDSAAARDMTIKLAQNFVPVGWNNNPGYNPVVVGGGFHNVQRCLETYKPQLDCVLDQIKKAGKNPIAFIMESTEMPAHSNSIREQVNLPVWDISTLGMCVMQASRTFADQAGGLEVGSINMFSVLFADKSFAECMLSWFTKTPRYETKFGQQSDGSLMFYEDIDPDYVENMTCSGGRPPTLKGGIAKVGRPMSSYNPGLPLKPGQVNEACWTTGLCQCSSEPYGSYGPGCAQACPGSGNCGGGTWGPQLALNGSEGYPCGADGAGCPGKTPPIVLDPGSDERNENSNACEYPASDADDLVCDYLSQ